ncbi:MAG: hypothetical protein ACEQSK_06905 [Sphingomonadaceae bacterium]
MTNYKKYATTSARSERADMCLAIGLVAVDFALAVDLFVRGTDSLFGLAFMALVRWTA